MTSSNNNNVKSVSQDDLTRVTLLLNNNFPSEEEGVGVEVELATIAAKSIAHGSHDNHSSLSRASSSGSLVEHNNTAISSTQANEIQINPPSNANININNNQNNNNSNNKPAHENVNRNLINFLTEKGIANTNTTTTTTTTTSTNNNNISSSSNIMDENCDADDSSFTNKSIFLHQAEKSVDYGDEEEKEENKNNSNALLLEGEQQQQQKIFQYLNNLNANTATNTANTMEIKAETNSASTPSERDHRKDLPRRRSFDTDMQGVEMKVCVTNSNEDVAQLCISDASSSPKKRSLYTSLSPIDTNREVCVSFSTDTCSVLSKIQQHHLNGSNRQKSLENGTLYFNNSLLYGYSNKYSVQM